MLTISLSLSLPILTSAPSSVCASVVVSLLAHVRGCLHHSAAPLFCASGPGVCRQIDRRRLSAAARPAGREETNKKTELVSNSFR